MSSTRRSWMAAASIAAVETLKDRGLYRWNYTMRSLHQHYVENNLRSINSQANKLSSSPSSAVVNSSNNKVREQAKDAGESLRKVVYLSCWGL
ncbi:hypothetical protein Ddye_018485 [Dipteronia dyeriana]|uniref:Wound-responsive family protein n=1 Tax=Dipteronia dyeriana TaxID=168575 RepID=A0AAD9UAK4_9ROSI|nr:hypothetical protein Ddye_018485 [Dipteronia dyeriana]